MSLDVDRITARFALIFGSVGVAFCVSGVKVEGSCVEIAILAAVDCAFLGPEPLLLRRRSCWLLPYSSREAQGFYAANLHSFTCWEEVAEYVHQLRIDEAIPALLVTWPCLIFISCCHSCQCLT